MLHRESLPNKSGFANATAASPFTPPFARASPGRCTSCNSAALALVRRALRLHGRESMAARTDPIVVDDDRPRPRPIINGEVIDINDDENDSTRRKRPREEIDLLNDDDDEVGYKGTIVYDIRWDRYNGVCHLVPCPMGSHWFPPEGNQ